MNKTCFLILFLFDPLPECKKKYLSTMMISDIQNNILFTWM